MTKLVSEISVLILVQGYAEHMLLVEQPHISQVVHAILDMKETLSDIVQGSLQVTIILKSCLK